MTDAQIRETVARMRMRDAERQILLRRALAGEPGARFVIFAQRRRQEVPAK